jgi:hypothetical protein
MKNTAVVFLADEDPGYEIPGLIKPIRNNGELLR